MIRDGKRRPRRRLRVLKKRIARRLSLSTKLTLSYVGVVGFSLAVLATAYVAITTSVVRRFSREEAYEVVEVVISTLEYAVLMEDEAALRSSAEAAERYIRSLVAQAQDGTLDEATAQERANNFVARETIGETGYYFIFDESGNFIHHPYEEISGRNFSDSQIFSEINDGKTYIEYLWANPSDTAPRPKTAYVTYVEEWGWYVCASDYKMGLFSRVPQARMRRLLSQLVHGGITSLVLRDELGQIEVGSSTHSPGELDRPIEPNIHRHRVDGGDRFQYIVNEQLDEYGLYVSAVVDLQIHDEMIEAHWTYLLIALGAVSIVLIGLSIAVSRRVFGPLERVTARLLSRLGSPAANPAPKDEISSLVAQQMRAIYALEKERKERSRAEYDLSIAEAAFTSTAEGVCVTDSEGTIIRVNDAFTRQTGFSAAEALGENPRILKSSRHSDQFYTDMWNQLRCGGAWSGEIWNRRKDGTEYPELLSIVKIEGQTENAGDYVAVFRDITEIKDAENRLQHLATHDELTGLPNRSLLEAMVEKTLRSQDRTPTSSAVLFIDIDDFKDVNDSFGHVSGDLLLRWVAARIKYQVRPEDTVARFGGDEFVVFLRNVGDEEQAAQVSERIIRAVGKPYRLLGHRLKRTVSIGIAVSSLSVDSPIKLLQNADAAMYEAKKDRKNGYRFHDPSLNQKAHNRIAMRERVLHAIRNNELTIAYQPILCLKTNRVVGAEALVRWIRNGDLVPPGDFLPYVEHTSAITKLDLWILEHALQDVSENPILPPDFFVSVNAAAIDLTNDSFVDSVATLLERSGISPQSIRLEVTESAAIRNFEKARSTITRIRALGVRVYLDDFGEGYSSIRYLREFGVDAVKLDRSYVTGIPASDASRSLVSGFVQLAHGIELSAIIEGVETPTQLTFLKESRADFAQGFIIGKPGPIGNLVDLFRSGGLVIVPEAS